MKIGIIELMPKGHFTLVESVARIYTSSLNNEVTVCTNNTNAAILQSLSQKCNRQVNFLIKDDNQSISSFLTSLNEKDFDLIYIVTLEKYLKDFYHFNINCPIHLFIHNINTWMDTGLTQRLRLFFADLLRSKNIIYSYKYNITAGLWRKKIIEKILQRRGKLVVLNSILKEELSHYTSPNNITVIPFSVYDSDIEDKSINNTRIRICIPGMISSMRRDYSSVLKMLESNPAVFKNTIELDLLGGVSPAEGGEDIIIHAKKLIEEGFTIYYYDKPLVPLNEFDEELSKANIILGNMNTVINKYNIYGKTKDSGIIYTMMKAAKPGLLPNEYQLIDELKTSVLLFNDYKDLATILMDLIQFPDKLNQLTSAAKKNSLKFEPAFLLKNL